MTRRVKVVELADAIEGLHREGMSTCERDDNAIELFPVRIQLAHPRTHDHVYVLVVAIQWSTNHAELYLAALAAYYR